MAKIKVEINVDGKKIANEILDKGIVDGKQTLGIQDFYTRYNDAIHKSASPDNFLS